MGAIRDLATALGSRVVLAAGLALLLAVPTATAAQEPPPGEAEGETSAVPAAGRQPSEGIEEIVVTTQKREQSPQDIGISVTAFSGDTVDELRIEESVDIAAQTPNLNIGFPAGETNHPAIFLRGVGLNDFNANANGSVGWYTDDVYISQIGGQTFQLFDLERVEVARGPQGTLYGRNTTAGLVNFISRKPDHEERSGYLSTSYGKYDAVQVKGAAGGPLAEGLAGRAAFVYSYADGWLDNRLPGRGDNNDVKNWGGRTLLSWQPSDDLDLLLNVHGGQNLSQAWQYQHQGLLDPVTFGSCAFPNTPGACVDALGYTDPTNPEFGRYNKVGNLDLDVWGSSLTATWTLGEFRVTSLTAYEYLDRIFEEETDASPNRLIEIDWSNDSWQLTQELRVASGGERYDWVAGVYYYADRTQADNVVDLFRDLRPLIESIDPVAYPGGFDPFGAAIGAPTLVGRSKYTQEVESLAVFGQAEFALTEAVRLTLGGRFTWEGREFRESARLVEPGFVIELFRLDEDDDFQEWSGRVGLDWRPVEDVLLYASASRGFKSGGFNGGFGFDPSEIPPFDPEILYAYEAGVKWELLDRRLRLNLSAFYYDYKDLQVFTLVSTGVTPIQVLENASDAEVFGGELELVARPIEGLEAVLGLGLLESELKDFESAGEDFSGNELVLAPTVSFNGQLRYELPVGPGSAYVQTDFSYQDDVFFDTTNRSLLSEDAYWLFNGRLGYAFGDGRYELALWAKNLFDEEYLTYVIDLSDFGFNEQMWGVPRTYGAELTLRF